VRAYNDNNVRIYLSLSIYLCIIVAAPEQRLIRGVPGGSKSVKSVKSAQKSLKNCQKSKVLSRNKNRLNTLSDW